MNTTGDATAVKSWLARGTVAVILIGALCFVRLASTLRVVLGRNRRAKADQRRLLVTGTFYNQGWFQSHILPLSALSTLDEVIVVCDEKLTPLPRVTYACPPRWMQIAFSRPLARFIWLAASAWRMRPATLMGYHIMPNALLCLIVARALGLHSVYQMTGGPIQIIGGGVGSENRLLRLQQKPSRWRESLMFRLVRQFDLVVVRGSNALEFVEKHDLARKCMIVPGSVDCERFTPQNGQKVYDLVCVGRLVPVKRHDRFVAIVEQMRRLHAQTRTVVVGDGPLLDRTQTDARKRSLDECIDFVGRRTDVERILGQARLFLITSETEGLSIAVLEALAAGVPVCAPLVGDLSEVLIHDVTGVCVDPDDAEGTARAIVDLLGDPHRLAHMATTARNTALLRISVPAVTAIWQQYFDPGHERRNGDQPTQRVRLPQFEQQSSSRSLAEVISSDASALT